MTSPEQQPEPAIDIPFYETIHQEAERFRQLIDTEAEFVPTSAEIVSLKSLVRDQHYAGHEICAYIATALYVPSVDEDHARLSEDPPEELPIARDDPRSPIGAMRVIGALAADWRLSLEKGIQTPGDEWPDGPEGAAIFIHAQRRMEAERASTPE